VAYEKALELEPDNEQLKDKLVEMRGLVEEKKKEQGANPAEKPTKQKKPEAEKPTKQKATGKDSLGTPSEQIEVLLMTMPELIQKWDFEQCLIVRDKIYELQKMNGKERHVLDIGTAELVAKAPTAATPQLVGSAKKAPANKQAEAPKSAPPPTGMKDEESSEEETEDEKAAKIALNAKRAETLKDKGNKALQAGDTDKAISSYSMAIRLAPQNHTYYSNRSAAHLKTKDFKNALKDAQECVKLKSDWSKGYTRLGAAFYSLNMYQSARKAYSTAHELDPENAATLKQLEDTKPLAEKSQFSLKQEEEWLVADNREQMKREACGQQ